MTQPLVQPSVDSVPLQMVGSTDTGRRRDHNEDVHGVYPELRMAIVADGMGGAAGGATAARITVEELERFFRSHRQRPSHDWPFPVERTRTVGANLLRVGLQVANRHVRDKARTTPGLEKMGSTAAAIAIGECTVAISHVGDVRVYRLREQKLERLTRDHTVKEQVRDLQPDITEAELEKIPQRDMVTKVVGMGDELDPSMSVHALEPGDLFLLCCDGLWGPVGEETIGDILIGTPDMDEACTSLIMAANDAGGPDNITAVLVRAG
jgi:protein phosphatase